MTRPEIFMSNIGILKCQQQKIPFPLFLYPFFLFRFFKYISLKSYKGNLTCNFFYVLLPNWPTGPIRSSSRNVCVLSFVVCCPPPMRFFSMDRVRIFAWTESAFLVRIGGLEQSLKNGDAFWLPPPLTVKEEAVITSYIFYQ